MADIKHFVVIKAPVNTVYKAITEQEGIAGWWSRDIIAKPEPGFVNEIKFGDRYHNKMKITKLEKDKVVGWECIGGDREWVDTSISFELEEKNGKTELMFTHANWAGQTLFYANCNFHWGGYMKSLKDYAETGKGKPNHDNEY
ncbi:MAG: SRPBCC domain-containing protein [Bacteroidota bacterium]|nr:SRPBCC domain-containing protein [Bacteroidota bacterium]